MSPQNSRTRWSLAALIGALALVLLPATTAAAQSPSQTGDYSGSGDSAIVDLDVAEAQQIPSGQLLDAVLAPTRQASDTTDGLSAEGIEGDGHVAFGEGTNIKSQLAGNDLISDVLVEAEQTAPPDHQEPTVDEGGSFPENPLLTATIAHAEALARDIGPQGDACPGDGAPHVTSRGYSEVAEAEVLPGQLPDSASAVTVNETVSSETLTQLVSIDGQDGLGVQSRSIADLTSLSLFGQVDVTVASPPTLTATAAGTSGSSSLTYNDPVVTINGQELVDELTITIGPDGQADLPSQLDPLEQALQPALDGLEQLFQQANVTALRIEKTGVLDQSVGATEVSGTASLLQVELLAADQGTLLSIDVAPMQAQATAPDGGVDCDGDGDDVVEVTKDGPTSVQPGETFDYTIEVGNTAPECTLEGVTVTDVITGPEGSEVTSTQPEATEVTGDFAADDGVTVTWSDVGSIEPGGSETFTVSVSVPDGSSGQAYTDDAEATATCAGDEVSGQDDMDGPSVGGGGVAGEGDQRDGDGLGDVADTGLPRTGGGALAVLGLGGLLGAAALTRRS